MKKKTPTSKSTTNLDKYYDNIEIKRRITIAQNATMALTNIRKDRPISLRTKKKQLNFLVFSFARYGSEFWVLKNSDKKRIEKFRTMVLQTNTYYQLERKETNEAIQKVNTHEDS